MIRRIYVDNYKCLVNFELSFDRLTLLIGPNGVGKSAVLDVIFSLRQLLSDDQIPRSSRKRSHGADAFIARIR